MVKKLGLGCGGLVVLLIVLAVIGAAIGSPKKSAAKPPPSAPPVATDAPPATSAPPTQAPVRTLVDHQGTGQWTSPTFNAPSDWAIGYGYDCSSFGQSGNFIVSVYGPGNQLSADGVNELKMRGHGVTYVHDVSGPGTYLQVNSECAWRVKAAG